MSKFSFFRTRIFLKFILLEQMNLPEHFESYIQRDTPKTLLHNQEMSHVIQVICNIVLLDKSAEDNTRKVGKWRAIRLEGIVWFWHIPCWNHNLTSKLAIKLHTKYCSKLDRFIKMNLRWIKTKTLNSLSYTDSNCQG